MEEAVTALVNRGYAVLSTYDVVYQERTKNGTFTEQAGLAELKGLVETWGAEVLSELAAAFPTEFERNVFRRQRSQSDVSYVGMNQKVGEVRSRMTDLLTNLEEVLTTHIPRYTDLPIGVRLYVEDIDSFRSVRDVNPSQVAHLLGTDGYLDISEDQLQLGLEQILGVSMHKKDWGGEINDLYTANTLVNGARVASAFLLKGNGLKNKVMQIADCGKNGDQLVRLLDSPAVLFFVQFVGNVAENVIRDIDGKIGVLRSRGVNAHYCIMDGQDTARVLLAYGKLAAASP